MTGMVGMTFYSYLICSIAAILAVIYFFIQIPALKSKYRILAYMNIFVCGFSALLHFYYFNVMNGAMTSGLDATAASEAIMSHALEVRYFYWLTCTVLLVTMFPLLIGLDKVGTKFLGQLAVADAGMIICGFFGESSINEAGQMTPTGLMLFIIGCALWVYMVVRIFFVLRSLPSSELTPPQRDTLAYMFFFVMLAWSIYPVGYYFVSYFEDAAGVILREFTFNLGDIVNKVIWGLMVVTAARKVSDIEKGRRLDLV
jgi:hypothetical protein